MSTCQLWNPHSPLHLRDSDDYDNHMLFKCADFRILNEFNSQIKWARLISEFVMRFFLTVLKFCSLQIRFVNFYWSNSRNYIWSFKILPIHIRLAVFLPTTSTKLPSDCTGITSFGA